jgi:hypothetical protein
MKYVWSATGLLIIAIPSFFFEKRDGLENTGDAISTRTKDYITAKGLLVSDSYLLYRAPILVIFLDTVIIIRAVFFETL